MDFDWEKIKQKYHQIENLTEEQAVDVYDYIQKEVYQWVNEFEQTESELNQWLKLDQVYLNKKLAQFGKFSLEAADPYPAHWLAFQKELVEHTDNKKS